MKQEKIEEIMNTYFAKGHEAGARDMWEAFKKHCEYRLFGTAKNYFDEGCHHAFFTSKHELCRPDTCPIAKSMKGGSK